MNKPRSPVAGFIYTILATLFWVSIPITVKYCVRVMDAYTICWIRFAAGTPLLFLIAAGRGCLKCVKRQDIPLIILGGFGIGLDYIAYIRGIQSTTASAANVIVQFEVISLIILGRIWLGEKMNKLGIFGAVITCAGVFLALWNGESFASLTGSRYFFGNMLILIASPLWAVYGISQKVLTDRDVPISASLSYIFAVATIVTFPAALFGFDIHGQFSSTIGFSLFILVVFGTVGSYLLMGKGFEHLDASTAGVITSMLPVFTIIAARIFLSEPISLTVGLGAVLVVTGVIITGQAEVMKTDRI